MNVITSERTYATVENAIKALERAGIDLDKERWLISVAFNRGQPQKRFVPTLVGAQYVQYAFQGIMVVG